MKEKLPNNIIVLILGIISMPLCFCYGIGIITGTIGIVLAQKDLKFYRENPERYEGLGNVQAGKVMSIIGIVLSVLFLLIIVWMISIVGMDAVGNEALMTERIQDYLDRLED